MIRSNIIIFRFVFISLLLTFSYSVNAGEKKSITLEDFIKLPVHRNVQVSPDGSYLSVVFKKEGEDLLAILEKETLKPVNAFRARGEGKGIGSVYWVNDRRLVYSLTERKSWDKRLIDTGELVGVDIDGKGHELIFGYKAGQQQTGTRLKKKESSYGHHSIIDLLKDDDKYILIAFYKWKVVGNYWKTDHDAEPIIYKLNVYSGTKRRVGRLPHPGATGITDNNGYVRFAVSVNNNNRYVLSYKKDKEADWQDFQPKDFEGVKPFPLSFTADNNSVYLAANAGNGTRALYLFNLKDNSFEKVFHDEKVDISDFINDFDGRRVVVVGTSLAKPEYHYLDRKDQKAKLHQKLGEAFDGYGFSITSITDDRSEMIVHVYSDINPGDYYLFDTKTFKADFLLTSRPWIDLSQTLPMQHMEFKTRDNTTIYGFVTLPPGKETNVPLVVMPHGGPHGVRDRWGFEWEAQLLASRGYAVLQVNYRGSGGYGIEFQEVGHGKWGTLMQDDITDATLALVEQGMVDPNRMCIYGGSYGGYAALMGAVKEPELYQCAIGSVGVYNLPMMFEKGDIAERERSLAYLYDVLGDDLEDQKARSPVYNVDKIKAKILLIHGTKDQRVPIEQAQSLMDAFDKIHKKYEWLELRNEGHGYYDEGNRMKIYSKLLEFLDKNIGS